MLLGFLIKKFKMSYLIAGYNTAPKKEKEKYDEKKLINQVGNNLMISASVLIFSGLLIFMFKEYAGIIQWISWFVFIILVLGNVIYMNTTNVVKKKERNSP